MTGLYSMIIGAVLGYIIGNGYKKLFITFGRKEGVGHSVRTTIGTVGFYAALIILSLPLVYWQAKDTSSRIIGGIAFRFFLWVYVGIPISLIAGFIRYLKKHGYQSNRSPDQY